MFMQIIARGTYKQFAVSGIRVIETVSQTSDKRLKFNDKLLTNALNVITKNCNLLNMTKLTM